VGARPKIGSKEINMLKHSGIKPEVIKEIIDKKGARVYMIGIGGASMSALSRELLRRGAIISGSDSGSPERCRALRERGVEISSVHSREHLEGFCPELVVYTLAASENNEEYRYALENGIPAVSRAELLGALVGDYSRSVGISGSHGKSTVTAMLYHILGELGESPAVLEGAALYERRASAEDAKTLVFEACEYGDSFLKMHPSLAVVLNVELDHTDYFSDIGAICRSFSAYVCGAEQALVNIDDENARRIAENARERIFTFGERAGADCRFEITGENLGKYAFRIYYKERPEGVMSLSVPGRFNVSNSVAAICAAHLLGVPISEACAALSSFRGLPRRLERLDIPGAPIYYDYAHHPTEISAVIAALYEMGYERVGVIFCPHTYSRTKALMSDFAKALSAAHIVAITDIYAAREREIPGVSAESLALECRKMKVACAALNGEQAFSFVSRSGCDVIALMGAGELGGVISAARKMVDKGFSPCYNRGVK
jgi:UDP-N-acetylmuramate--alanine ligase